MSDDERMARADRIRRMREGQRSNDESEDESANEPAADEPANEPTTDDAEADDEPTDERDDAETVDTADEQPDDAVEQLDESVDATADRAATDDDSAQPTRADGAEEPQEDSMNESTSTSETEASSETDDEPDPQSIAQRAAQAAAEVAGSGSTSDHDPTSTAGSVESGAATDDTASADSTLGGTDEMAQGPTGVELPDQADIDAAIEAAGGSVQSAEAIDGAEQSPRAASASTTTEESTRVLEFTLGDEHYCIDISLVEEIVKRDSITRVPNTDEYIEGVVDLRGQITTILDPKALMDIDAAGSESLMIVFDPNAFDDQGALGWIVDEVRQVAPIVESEVNQPPVDEDYIRGVVDREDSEEFVIWTKPEVAITLATIDESED